MEKQVSVTDANAALDPQGVQPVVDHKIDEDGVDIIRFYNLIPGLINSDDVENMETRVAVIAATRDPKNGRLVVDYTADGGEVQRLDFAALITVLEKETAHYAESTKNSFDGLLMEPKYTDVRGNFPYGSLYDLVGLTYLNCFVLLDLARHVELAFLWHGFRSDPKKALDRGIGRIVENLWCIANL